MAKFTKTTETNTTRAKGEPGVTGCNLVHIENRPWLTAFANVVFEGPLFMNSIAVRLKGNGEPYLAFPGKKRMKNGAEVVNESGYPIYDNYYGPADAQTREKLEKMVLTAVEKKLNGEELPITEKGADKVIVHLVPQNEKLVAMCNVVMSGKFFMTGISVNEVMNGERKGEVYLQYPARKRTKNGADVLDKNGKPIYDNYFGPATKEANQKLLEMVVGGVQQKMYAQAQLQQQQMQPTEANPTV